MLCLNERVTGLCEEGAFAVLDRALALKAQGKPIINLGIGQPDFSPPEHVLLAAERAARDGPHGYTQPIGLLALREAVADQLNARYANDVDPDQVVIVPGGKVTIYFAAMLFGGKDHEILYPDPGFPPYLEAIRASGAKPVAYAIRESDEFSFDPQEILDAITPQTSLIILNSPANPTGGVVSADALADLVAGLEKQPHVAILSDEIYSELVFDTEAFRSLAQYPQLRQRLILLSGWSKTFAMTGWRLGYGVWPLALVEHVSKLITVDHSCVNGVAQMAALAATTGPMDDVRRFCQVFKSRRDVLIPALNDLPGIECRIPGGAFYAFPNIRNTGQTSATLAKRLLEETSIALIPGDSFGNLGEGYLRISFAADIAEINEAMERLGTFLAELPGIRA